MSLRPVLALTYRQHFRHFVEITDLDCSMRLEHLRKHPRLAGESAGMAHNRVPGSLALADLENDNRLSIGGCSIKRGDKRLRLAHCFSKGGDHLSGRIID